MLYRYGVRFYVTGTDHGGYCSGVDDSEADEVSYFTTRTIERNSPINKMQDFNFHQGCTSDGSGYCKISGTTFVAVRICYLELISEEVEEVEEEFNCEPEFDIENHISNLNMYFIKNEEGSDSDDE